MEWKLIMLTTATMTLVCGAVAQELVALKVTAAKPVFRSEFGCGDIRVRNLEPARSGRPRPPVMVPPDATNLISCGCSVISSDPHVSAVQLALITDGDKEHEDDESVVELASGLQWVQIDLGRTREIHAVSVWHFHGFIRAYYDVICQMSDDEWFHDGVETVFNSDDDNSSGLGVGSDKSYIERCEGRTFAAGGKKARYVRLYSNGNTSNGKNHYVEVEVYGK